MFEQPKSEELLDRIIESIQELLTNDDKDIFKIRKLMSIFDDSIAVKREVRAAKVTTKVELENTLKEMEEACEEERKRLGQLEGTLSKEREIVKGYKNKAIALISKVLLSVYEMKQIESMVETNLRREEINKLLKEKSKDIQNQYIEEEVKICEGYNNKTQDAILKQLQDELEATVKEKEEELHRLEDRIERYTFEEKEMQSNYRHALDMQNQERREAIKFCQKYNLTSMISKGNSKIKKPPVIYTPVQPEAIEVRIIPQEQPVKIQTGLIVILTFLTLLLLTYAFTRSQ